MRARARHLFCPLRAGRAPRRSARSGQAHILPTGFCGAAQRIHDRRYIHRVPCLATHDMCLEVCHTIFTMPAFNTMHLLLPFSLPARAMMDAPVTHGQWPAFSAFIARARQVEHVRELAFARALPHQRWLARYFGALKDQRRDAAPLAPYMQLADCIEAGMPAPQAMENMDGAVWGCIEPVHVRIAHDHLVLTEPAQLALSAHEAAQLLNAARPVAAALGIALVAPTPLRWYVRDPLLTTLNCASPQAAAGRNIEIWLPARSDTGGRSLAWMKLQNEVQMAWFEHPVNRARETRGAPPVNSIWLHGCGGLQSVERSFSHLYSHQIATRGLGFAARAEVKPLPESFDVLSTQRATIFAELDTLTPAFTARDWPAWRAALADLERRWFAPACAALHGGALRRLTLTLSGEASALTLTATRADLYKFWRRTLFGSLLA